MEILSGELVTNELTKNANGGSELMAKRIQMALPKDLMKDFQIICSRVRNLDNTKYRILWCHDLAMDPEAKKVLENGGWNNFHKIVFVSYWQRQQFIDAYQIPFYKTAVIQNGIKPFNVHRPNDPATAFIYHTTPHRGLGILVPVIDALSKKYDIHLNVYSSFSVYGWAERDEPYKDLFDYISNHPNMTYHGGKDNDTIRMALKYSDIYAYPCVWPETSCLSLIEAMAAGLICVHSDLAALPETSGHLTTMYGFDEDHSAHAATLYHILDNVLSNKQVYEEKAAMASIYANLIYNIENKAEQWKALLINVKQEPLMATQNPSEYFTYTT